MSLKRPTAREYGILGLVNAAAAAVLALRFHAWIAVYFALLAAGAFLCALRARASGSSVPTR